jgi:Eukaryotic glutathione synthase
MQSMLLVAPAHNTLIHAKTFLRSTACIVITERLSIVQQALCRCCRTVAALTSSIFAYIIVYVFCCNCLFCRYTPNDYPSDKEWSGRRLIESSLAIKCPNIGYHLAGTKKVCYLALLCLMVTVNASVTSSALRKLRACMLTQTLQDNT